MPTKQKAKTKNKLLNIKGPFITVVQSDDSHYSHYGKDEDSWMLKVGAECNRLLYLAERLEKSKTAWKPQLARDIRSIVERVEEFEELR